jgi:hypothetical protein
MTRSLEFGHGRHSVCAGEVAEADGFSLWQYVYKMIRGPSGPHVKANWPMFLVVAGWCGGTCGTAYGTYSRECSIGALRPRGPIIRR